MGEKAKHVMEGYRILDFTQAIAGPTCTRLMAEMGAEVIKVELTPGGDMARVLPFYKDGRSGCFVQQNRGKKSLCINPKDPRGAEVIKDLIEKSDVVVENFAAGVISRLGFGWDVVEKINPKVIMCSISAFGQTGPLSRLPGFDFIAASYAGVLDMIGEPDGAPMWPMLALGDATTGVHALAAINAALLYKERFGEGQYLDISLLDSYFHQHDVNVEVYSASGGEISPKRAGAQHYAIAPVGVFKGTDSYMFIVALEHQWPQLCKAIGREDLLQDPRFNGPARAENRLELAGIIEDWIQSQESDAAALAILEAERVPVAPILSVPEAMAHPHLIERQTIRTIEDPVLGEFQIPGMPLRFSRFPETLTLRAPFLGEHNHEVLGDTLSMSSEKIAEMEADGVLGGEELPASLALAGE